MAINVDKVYRVTLSILNKEQRGYLTPDQFNRLGRQAQLDLLEKSFYDYNRALTRGDFGKADLIYEKIEAMITDATLTFAAGSAPAPADSYRTTLISTDSRSIEVTPTNRRDLIYLNASKLNQPDASCPVYFESGDTFKIFPTTITSATIDYVKKPLDPIWAFTGGGASAYVYDAGTSVDFELHPSEETQLVVRILALAGLIIKDPTIVEIAQVKQADNFNTENA